MTSQQTKRPWALLVSIVAAIALVAGATFYGMSGAKLPWQKEPSPTISAYGYDAGEGVRIDGDAIPRDISAHYGSIPAATFSHQQILGKPLEINPSGKLKKFMTITLPIDRVPGKNFMPYAAANFTHKPGDWQLIPAKVTPDKKHIVFVTSHLSNFQAIGYDLKEAARIIHEDFVDGLTSGLTKAAKQPVCTADATTSKYGVTVTGGNSIYWCLSHENGVLKLKVTNRASYPVELKTSGLTAPPQSAKNLSLTELARTGGHIVLEPAGQLEFTFSELAQGKKATLNVELSKFSLGLHTVDVMSNALFTLLAKFNLGSAEKKIDLISKALDAKNCLGTLGSLNAGDILANCFTEDVLKEFFDWRYVIIGPALAFVGLVEMSHSLAAAYGASQVDQTKSQLTVAKKPDGPPSWLQPYIGTWMTVGIYAEVYKNSTGTFIWWENGSSRSYRAPFSVKQSGPRAIATVTASDVTQFSSSTGDYAFVPGQQFSLDLQPNGVLAFNGINADGEMLFCSPHMDATICGGYTDSNGITHWTGQ